MYLGTVAKRLGLVRDLRKGGHREDEKQNV